jgi:hypothetical protein
MCFFFLCHIEIDLIVAVGVIEGLEVGEVEGVAVTEVEGEEVGVQDGEEVVVRVRHQQTGPIGGHWQPLATVDWGSFILKLMKEEKK